MNSEKVLLHFESAHDERFFWKHMKNACDA